MTRPEALGLSAVVAGTRDLLASAAGGHRHPGRPGRCPPSWPIAARSGQVLLNLAAWMYQAGSARLCIRRAQQDYGVQQDDGRSASNGMGEPCPRTNSC
jgi:hypothetical protein